MGRWQRRLLRTVITQDHTLTKTLQLRNTTAHRRDQTQSPYNPTARPAPATAAKAADEKGSAFRQHYNKTPVPLPHTTKKHPPRLPPDIAPCLPAAQKQQTPAAPQPRAATAA